MTNRHSQPSQPSPHRNPSPSGVQPINEVTYRVRSSGLASVPKRLHLLLTVEREMARGRALHGPFHSVHEGYAVALEEFNELWDEIKKKEGARDLAKLRDEALQVAAVLIRMCEELT